MFPLSVLLSLFVQRSNDVDYLDWIIKIGAALLFFGIPLIKGIVQSRDKAKEDAAKVDRRDTRSKEIEGRRAFDELMRRETTLEPPRVSTPPPLVSTREPETTMRSAQRATTAARSLTEREEISAAPLSGSEFEAEEGAPDKEIIARAERRERDELERQQSELRAPAEIAREEYAAASAMRASVEPVPVEVFRAPAIEVARGPASSEATRRWLAGTSGAERRAALRRALVMNEVLGRPAAMRDAADPTLPAGLRG